MREENDLLRVLPLEDRLRIAAVLDASGTALYGVTTSSSNDKGTPGQSRGRKATGPRSPPRRRTVGATKDPTTAELLNELLGVWRWMTRCPRWVAEGLALLGGGHTCHAVNSHVSASPSSLQLRL
jgi:hypothetical protein